eukprot:356174-Chlamydomonas_euryale.AAC.6
MARPRHSRGLSRAVRAVVLKRWQCGPTAGKGQSRAMGNANQAKVLPPQPRAHRAVPSVHKRGDARIARLTARSVRL